MYSYALSPWDVEALLDSGAVVLDLREAFSFGSVHIPGSINVDFSVEPKYSWVETVVSRTANIVLVLTYDEQFEDVSYGLRGLGYGNIAGWIKGGIHAWIGSGKDTESLEYISVTPLKRRLAMPRPPIVLDVRTSEEFSEGHISTAVNYGFESILKGEPYPVSVENEAVIVCKGGFRAAIAASLLKLQSKGHVAILTGGMDAWDAT